jgi:GTP cyclohydrolase I
MMTRSQRDLPAIERKVRELLELLGLDLARPDLAATPRRVARMYDEILGGMNGAARPEITVFPNEENYRSIVLVREIDFYSLCAHHLVPFFGKAHIAYLPAERIAGLSKLARVVEFFARRPQMQERLTEEVADFLETALAPRGVMVVLEARHLCMEMRGVEKPGALTVTSTTRGLFAEPEAGREFREEARALIARPVAPR